MGIHYSQVLDVGAVLTCGQKTMTSLLSGTCSIDLYARPLRNLRKKTMINILIGNFYCNLSSFDGFFSIIEKDTALNL